MDLKDILVCLDPTAAGEARFRLAAAVARDSRAHLSAAYILPEAIPGAPPYGTAGVAVPTGAAWMPSGAPTSGADTTRGPDLAEIVEQRFREELRPHAIEGDWQVLGPGEGGDLIALAATFDLVIYGQTSPDYRLPTGFRPEDVILGAGRPTLVVPYAGAFAAVGRRVLVAWDGTREASRALHDAFPLIRHAEAATVLTVRDHEGDFASDAPSVTRIVKHLGHHGVTAHPEQALRGDLPIAELLLSRASDLDADLIVSGAYHHSQLREALVGGVSRALLDHMTVPVLMSH